MRAICCRDRLHIWPRRQLRMLAEQSSYKGYKLTTGAHIIFTAQMLAQGKHSLTRLVKQSLPIFTE